MRAQKFSEQHKRRIAESLKGRVPWNKGGKLSEQARRNISEGMRGRIMPEAQKEKLRQAATGKSRPWLKGNKHAAGKSPWNKGKKWSAEFSEKSSLSHKRFYDLHDRADVRRYHHTNDRHYLKWRLAVFDRDGFTCQVCRKVGGNLNAHHIQSWAKCPAGRYAVENGVTLCEPCHRLEHKGQK